jgi:hypothetical protein
LAALTFVIVLAGAAVATAGDWSGQEVEKGGVRHVVNPNRPVEPAETAVLREVWRAGGDDEDDDVLFAVLDDVAVDGGGNVYLLDSQLNTVHVFSSLGEYLRSIGRQGEGPGEFNMPRSLFITPDGLVAVVQMMPGRIILLTPDGESAGLHPLPEFEGVPMFLFGGSAGENVFLRVMETTGQPGGSFTTTSALIRVDGTGDKTATYIQEAMEQNMSSLVFEERNMVGLSAWNAAPDGKVLADVEFDEYSIQVWDSDGTLDHVFGRDYEPRKRSKNEMARRGPFVKVSMDDGEVKNSVVKSETDRTVLGIYPRPDRSIWVLSSRGAYDTQDGELGTFDVFDPDGRFTRQLKLMGEGNFDRDGYYIIGDRLYILTEQNSARIALMGAGSGEGEGDPDEASPMKVICYELGEVMRSSR